MALKRALRENLKWFTGWFTRIDSKISAVAKHDRYSVYRDSQAKSKLELWACICDLVIWITDHRLWATSINWRTLHYLPCEYSQRYKMFVPLKVIVASFRVWFRLIIHNMISVIIFQLICIMRTEFNLTQTSSVLQNLELILLLIHHLWWQNQAARAPQAEVFVATVHVLITCSPIGKRLCRSFGTFLYNTLWDVELSQEKPFTLWAQWVEFSPCPSSTNE